MCNKPLSSLRINQRASRGDCGESVSNTAIVYEVDSCNRILHVILSFFTYGIWLIVWGLLENSAKNLTESNRREAVVLKKCKKCCSEDVTIIE